MIELDKFNYEFFNQYGGIPAFNKGDYYINLKGDEAFDGSNDFTLRESPFYPWFGGKCPVPDNVEVEVVFKDRSTTVCKAGIARWSNVFKDCYVPSDPDIIIAFRLTGNVL